MPQTWLLIVFSSLVALTSRGQQSYDASLIPDSLRTHAHVVQRLYDESFTVLSPSKAVYKVHEVRTILDKEARNQLAFVQYTSSFSKLESADINVFDAKGKSLQHIRQKDMNISGFGEGLVDDGQVTYFSVTAPDYPITLEMTYEVDYKGLLGYPSLSLNHTERSIQEEVFVLTVPKNIGVRYKNYGTAIEPQVTDGPKEVAVYTWKVEGIRGARSESGTLAGNAPRVMMGPTLFDMDDHPGNLSTWTQFGQWLYDLNKPTYTLPETSRPFYLHLVAGASTDRDKARILYHYLQKNFRYVSIQLGIGGWRSFPATLTEEKKYGDCKALSTYMKACLGAVGVKSYVAVINAGYDQAPVDTSFSINQFNHAILCIPQAGDSLWLECTSNRTDFGVLGDFTEDRNALLLTEQGGVLVRTPRSRMNENTSVTVAHVDLMADGSGKADISIQSTGAFKLSRVYQWYEETHDNQKKSVAASLRIQGPDTLNLSIGAVDSPVALASIHATFDQVPQFMVAGKMFLYPRVFTLWDSRLPSGEHRTQDYYFLYPFEIVDTTCYQLPAGYTIDNLPKGKSLRTPYIDYTSSYWYDTTGNAVYTSGRLRLTTRHIPVAAFEDAKKLLAGVEEDETEKVVIHVR